MGVRDFHYKPEFHLGYRWRHGFQLFDTSASLDVGYSVFLFTRSDIRSYVPLPGVLPLVALGNDLTKLNATWILGLGKTVQGDTLYLFITQVL